MFRKRLSLASSLVGAILIITLTPANSVENGVIVKDDQNAVYMFDGTGNQFLYNPYIVFVSAHSHEDWSKDPMVVHNMFGQSAKVEKLLVDPEFKDRNTSPESIANGTSIGSRHMDFAILILETPLPMTTKVSLATSDDIPSLIQNKTPIYMIGYSSHDSTKVRDGLARKLTGYLISETEAKSIFDYYYSNWFEFWGPKGAKYELGPINIVYSEEGGNGCDGDSGAGFYFLRGTEKVYLGPNGSHSVGVRNCGRPATFGPAGNVSNIEPVWNHLELIKTAEEYVAIKISKLQNEVKAKAEARVKVVTKKSTITCIKGKTTKKIIGVNPKCPLGFKKK